MSDGGFLEGFDTAPATSESTPEPAATPQDVFESAPQPEQVAEQTPATQVANETAPEPQPQVVAAAPEPVSAERATIQHDEVYDEVAKIVDEGLEHVTEHMDQASKERFEKKGEETKTLIAGLVRGFHVKASTVLELLKAWLLTIPGVNKFFLEQEVKIKTDKIIDLEQVRREDIEKA